MSLKNPTPSDERGIPTGAGVGESFQTVRNLKMYPPTHPPTFSVII